MGLERYRRIRDFAATPEPAGHKRAKPSGRLPSFVVQLHHASRRHYDFRLEIDGVLKSWAVPKGPSLRPSDKRLAVEVEDHPLSYASFAGDIPSGHYGAGHVAIFDEGTVELPDDPLAALVAGKLEIVMHGQRLQGGFKLVRTASKQSKPQWLLMKRNDDFAADTDADGMLDADGKPEPLAPAGAQVTARSRPGTRNAAPAAKQSSSKPSQPAPVSSIAGTAVDWTARAAAIDGGVPLPRKQLPADFELALCKPSDDVPAGDEWLHETKWDGYRMLAERAARGSTRLLSRNGLDWSDKLPGIVAVLDAVLPPASRVDGELIALDAEGRDDFAALQASFDGRAATHRLVLFDAPQFAGIDLRRAALIDRKALLRQWLADAPTGLAFSEHVIGHGSQVQSASAAAGSEGVVSKRTDSHYEGGRGRSWIKFRHIGTEDLVVVGYARDRRQPTVASLLLAGETESGLEYAGRAGTGFNADTAAELFATLEPLGIKVAAVPIVKGRHGSRDYTPVAPRVIVEVRDRGRSASGLLRHASFKRLRPDRSVSAATAQIADAALRDSPNAHSPSPGKAATAARSKATRSAGKTATTRKRTQSGATALMSEATRKAPAQPGRKAPAKAPSRSVTTKRTTGAKAQPSRAKGSSAKRSANGQAQAAALKLSSPERIVYPQMGVTKADVADYVTAMADWLLGEVAGRPLTLVRCPDGIQGECFVQKHLKPGFGGAVRALPGRDSTEALLAIDSLDGLLGLVQMNALELHVWGSRFKALETPDRIVFDLDPGPGVNWNAIRKAARDLRDRLRDLTLESFVRTTGGKGLHVVVPLDESVGWDGVRHFARAFAETLAATEPERFVANARLAKREGRIFVDWLRNGRGATAVAGFSLRARPGAPVAMPIAWDELSRIKGGDHYDIKSAPRRMARRSEHPWPDFAELAARQRCPQ